MVIFPRYIRCNDCLRQILVYGLVSYPPEVYIIYACTKLLRLIWGNSVIIIIIIIRFYSTVNSMKRMDEEWC